MRAYLLAHPEVLEEASQRLQVKQDADTQAAQMTTRLTQQFASMDSRVAAYKSTLSFLQQQVDAWNSND